MHEEALTHSCKDKSADMTETHKKKVKSLTAAF